MVKNKLNFFLWILTSRSSSSFFFSSHFFFYSHLFECVFFFILELHSFFFFRSFFLFLIIVSFGLRIVRIFMDYRPFSVRQRMFACSFCHCLSGIRDKRSIPNFLHLVKKPEGNAYLHQFSNRFATVSLSSQKNGFFFCFPIGTMFANMCVFLLQCNSNKFVEIK